MANQVIVTNTGNVQVALTPPANVQVQISRAAIGTVANVLSANFANFAGNVTSSSQPNITSLGTLTTLSATGTATFGNVVVIGNLSVGNLFANNANYSNFAGQVVDATQSNITSLGTLTGLSIAGNIIPTSNVTYDLGNNTNRFNDLYLAGNTIYIGAQEINANATGVSFTGNLTGDGSGLSNVAGANVTGVVANANYSAYANIAASANSVAVANVSGIGNIAVINLDGNASNVLFGNGVFGPESGNLNANYANFAGEAFNVNASNITGTVANANYSAYAGEANTANLATFATTANSVAGANVSGTVANATFALDAGNSNLANTANSVALANVVGIGNIANINLTGSSSNVLFGNGVFAPESTSIANANYANFAGTAFSVSGSNVSGEVANANYSSYANIAASANSVALANVVGIGNIANINLDGNISNTLLGNGTFGPYAANSSLLTGTILNSGVVSSGLTSVGILTSLSVTGNTNLGNIVTANFFSGDGSLLSNVNGGNVSNVANANYANFAGTAFSVSGSNVSGEVANANFASYANLASTANLATFATTANSVAGANVSGEVANANYSSYANIAATANSVAVANVSGIGNIAVINLDGSSSNVLFGNGVFAPESTNIANANYANFAGTVITNAQPNITSVGNLPYLQVSDSANSISVINQLASNAFPIVSSFSNLATYLLTTQYHPNNSLSYPADRTIRSRGNATTPTTAVSGDRIFNKSSLVYNGNTNVIAVAEIHTATGTVSNIANGSYTGGQWDISTGNPGGDPAITNNNSWLNSLQFNNSGTLAITPATPANSSLGQTSSSIVITNYGATVANLVQVGGITQQRARGNRANVQPVQAGDHVGRTLFYCYSNGAYQTGNSVQYRVVVDSTYVANDVVVPMSHQFTTMANVGGVATSRTTSINSTGNISMPGANIGAGVGGGQVSFGNDAGTTGQNNAAVAIGLRAANVSQGQQGVAIGYEAGSNTQSQFAVAIGGSAGRTLQGEDGVAIGRSAGQTNQGNLSVAIGYQAGKTTQSGTAVAIGINAGNTTQGTGALAVGSSAGANNQGNFTVAMGESAAFNNQGTQSVALGYYAGANTQGQYSVAIGRQAGEFSQGANSFALGYGAGQTNQGNNSISFGWAAGYTGQGNDAIAIGAQAGFTNQANNSIILNATGTQLNQTVANTFTVSPVRNDVANVGLVMFYNTTSKEVTYGNTISVAGSITSGNATVGTNGSGNIASIRLFGDKTNSSILSIKGAQFNAVVDGVNPFSGFSPFRFDTYDNSNNYIPPSRYYRARGTEASPASAQAGDNISINSYAVYADSGNVYKDLFNTVVSVVSNDNAGNVVASYDIINYGGANSFVNINVPTTYAQNLIANSSVTAANVQVNTNGFMKLASYTAAALTAITGQIGWMAAVSNSSGGGNPNGMIAFWDTTHSRWSYIHDNSAV